MPRKPLSVHIRRAVKARDGWRCVRCWSPDYLEVHHIQAVMDGGGDELENLALLCEPCHKEWTFVAEPAINVTYEEWLRMPSYLMLLSFWRSMRQCGADGTVVMSNGEPMDLAERAQEMERTWKELRATRQRDRLPGDGRPSCRACKLPFPERLPWKLEEYPELCRACDPDPKPLNRMYSPGELREREASA